jgi:hypothetical protein
MKEKELEVRRAKALHERTAPPRDKAAEKAGGKRRSSIREDVKPDTIAELRRLVGIHKNLATEIQRYESGIKDRHFKGDDGSDVLVKCTKSAAAIADVKRCVATFKADQADLVSAMLAELRKAPVYTTFLKNVYGVGIITAAYLVAMVRIERSQDFSQLNRYCGNAPDYKTGWREIRSGAPKFGPQGERTEGTGTFNEALRRNNWLIMTSMRKNGAKFTVCESHELLRPKSGAQPKEAFRAETLACEACRKTKFPVGTTNKYLDRWLAASHTERTAPREPRLGHGGKLRSPVPDHKGRMKATDVLLWDLYVVWRALEGLDMRHEKYSVQRGRDHAGREVNVDERFSLTVEQALEWVGDVGGRPATEPMLWKGVDVEAENAKAHAAAHGGEPVQEVAAE